MSGLTHLSFINTAALARCNRDGRTLLQPF
jgi:hypothetical protein